MSLVHRCLYHSQASSNQLIRVYCAGLRLQPQEPYTVRVPGALESALRRLGLEDAIGYMWMIPANVCSMPGSTQPRLGCVYVPYDISFGAPLYNPALCRMV